MDTAWIQVCIETSAAGIEPVCAYLTALGVGGLEIQEAADFALFADENRGCWDQVDESLQARLQDVNRVTCYFPLDEDGRARAAELQAGIPALQARCEGRCDQLSVTTRTIQEEDWANNWKQYYEPFPVGEKLYVVPEWDRDAPIPQGRTPLYLNPGLIFGTGSHSTTRLCLEGLESFLRPGEEVLDLGCGSGILSIAALVLGASRAKGCDIDPKAVRVAAENAGYNQVAHRLEVYCGDVTSDPALAAALAGQYPLVLANIIADVIIPLAPQVPDYLTPDGVFLCSGIISHRGEDTLSALEKAGLTVFWRREEEDWLAFAARKSG